MEMQHLVTCLLGWLMMLMMTPVICDVFFIAERLPLQGERAKPGSPWPMPLYWNRSETRSTIDHASFFITSIMAGCDVISEAIRRYQRLMFLDEGTKAGDGVVVVTKLLLQVQNTTCEQWPYMGMDESYNITIQEDANIQAVTQWGALRGLETFSQLVYTQDGKYWLNHTEIQDKPRFQHRGTMVDSSRHFLPVPILQRHIDAMAYNKMNVLHWHIVDAQSFPFVSSTFPELSAKGAYSSKHVYNKKDVQNILDYARLRGIRVVPEFDTPGHTHSWGQAFPELLTECWTKGLPEVPEYGQYAARENLDPTNNNTYSFLEKLLREVVAVFADGYVHLGLDEAHYMCWQSSPNISEFMREMGFGPKEYYKVEEFYAERVLNIIQKTGRKSIMWQDPIDNGAKVLNSTIVQIWKSDQPWERYAENITRQGHRVILSSPWYLSYISYGQDWQKYYAIDPTAFSGSQEAKSLVIGAEACMWGEYVDGTNLLQRFWPRASAVAERLWSSADVKDINSTTFRLDQQRCRMLRRGIPAQPVLPGFCGDYDFGFNLDPSPAQECQKNTDHVSSSSVFHGRFPMATTSFLIQVIVCCWLFLNIFQ